MLLLTKLVNIKNILAEHDDTNTTCSHFQEHLNNNGQLLCYGMLFTDILLSRYFMKWSIGQTVYALGNLTSYWPLK